MRAIYALTACLFICGSIQGQLPVQLVATFGTQVGSTDYLRSFAEDPYIDLKGSISFQTTVSDANGSDLAPALVRRDAAGFTLLAKSGSPTPLGGVFVQSNFFTDGQLGGPVAFFGTQESSSGTRRIIWGTGSGITPIAEQGTQAIGFPHGVTINRPGAIAVNPNGNFTYMASTSNGSAETFGGIFVNGGAGTALAAGSAMAVSGLPNLNWNSFHPYPTMTNDGRAVFRASVRDTTNNVDRTGLFLADSQSTSIIAMSGGSVPGAGSLTFGEIAVSQSKLNNAGGIAFRTSSDNSIWATDGNSYRLAAKSGSFITGGGQVQSPGDRFQIIDSGKVLLHAVTGSSSSALLVSDRDGLRALVRTGQVLPGLPSGSTLASIEHSTFNRSGQFAFTARVRLNNITTLGYLFSGDVNGRLDLVFAPGTSFPLSPTFSQTFNQALIYPFTDVARSQLNDNGQLVFRLASSTGSPAVATVFVPEPRLALLPLLLMVSCGRRHAKAEHNHLEHSQG